MHKHHTRSLLGVTQFEKRSCKETSLMVSPNWEGRWKWLKNFDILYLLGYLSVTKGMAGWEYMGHRPFHLPGPLLSGLLSAAAWEMLWTQGVENFCPSDILWRLLQGGGRRLSVELQEAASSPLRRTLRGGAGERTKCGWEASKASEDSMHWPQPSASFWFFSWGRKGEDRRRPPGWGRMCGWKRSSLSTVKLTPVAA